MVDIPSCFHLKALKLFCEYANYVINLILRLVYSHCISFEICTNDISLSGVRSSQQRFPERPCNTKKWVKSGEKKL